MGLAYLMLVKSNKFVTAMTNKTLKNRAIYDHGTYTKRIYEGLRQNLQGRFQSQDLPLKT